MSLLAVKAPFAISDDCPTDKSLKENGETMLHHILTPENGAPLWTGEYFAAGTNIARSHEAEMKQNNCTEMKQNNCGN